MNASIPTTTNLVATDRLPLTCIRLGICCQSKTVWLNPWELAFLAKEKCLTSRIFRDRYCDFGGIRMRFDGPSGWKGLAACSQYLPGRGCSVYAARPLVCRLFPLGRERRGRELHYIHQGNRFPCLDGCPEVVDLPRLTVAEYLAGQDVVAGEAALDVYLELMQRLADGAFVLLLESGLAAAGDRLTLRRWRELGTDEPERVVEYLGSEWIDRLMLPDLREIQTGDSVTFSRKHHDLLLKQTLDSFGKLESFAALSDASGVMMGLALHLGRGLGINPAEISRLWIATAKEHGAYE